MELPTVQTNEHASTYPPASNRVFSNLQRRRLDRLAGWLGRELHRLFRERIYTAAGFSSRLVHDRHFGEARNDELAATDAGVRDAPLRAVPGPPIAAVLIEPVSGGEVAA